MNKEERLGSVILENYQYDPITGIVANKKRPLKAIDKTIARGYVNIGIEHYTFRAHRVAWFLYYGKWPCDQIDHINGIRNDNRICNLREVDNRHNAQNRQIHINGKLPGCEKIKNRWRANIWIEGRSKKARSFKTELRAYIEYLGMVNILKEIGIDRFKNEYWPNYRGISNIAQKDTIG